MRTWENKIEEVIGKLSYTAWFQANHNKQGKRFKKHRPYRVPEEAQYLVECLGLHDRRKSEILAKEYMELLRIRRLSID
jgi:hypothetical protein